MNYNASLLLVALLLIGGSISAQILARFEVAPIHSLTELEMPVSVDIVKLTSLPGNKLVLSEISSERKTRIAFQIDETRNLTWLIKFKPGDGTKVFELSKGRSSSEKIIYAAKDNQNLTISSSGKNLLRYVHGMTYPPRGVDSAYRRSGFIHPLWTPHGQELTRIQPKDHYHHYGIWNPWTHVLYKGDTIDFWNIGSKKGTVRFADLKNISDGALFSEYKALHEHVVIKNNAKGEVAINELQTVRVYRLEPEKDYYIVDFTFDMTCATENPVTLLMYRYGGFGWRTTEVWDNKNSEVITSENKNRKDADGSLARWCIVQGSLNDDFGGAVMMSHPSNYNHPEPLRIWPENQYDRGDMFANFSPTKNKDWNLEPGKNYVLKYRLLVFNGKMTKESAEGAWQYYTRQNSVAIK